MQLSGRHATRNGCLYGKQCEEADFLKGERPFLLASIATDELAHPLGKPRHFRHYIYEVWYLAIFRALLPS